MGEVFRALDIADFYISLANDIPDNQIDNLKLNKLLFFAQGWYLSKFNRPLFSDEIQAWDLGPVVPDVYHIFKCCGGNDIEEPYEEFDENRLNGDEISLLIDVYNEYGKYTGWALKNMTHLEGTPWTKAYKKNQNCVIPLDEIKEFFDSQSLEEFDVSSLQIPVVTKIPTQWDDWEDEVYD